MDTATVQVETVPNQGGPQLLRVCAAGEIDCANAALLGGALAAALACGPGPVQVDLAAVSFIDCAGLKELEGACDAAGDRLRLVAASEFVWWMLRLFDMQQRFGPARAAGSHPTPRNA